jgi:hypothetical protein
MIQILDKNEGSIQLRIPPLNDYQNIEIKKKLIEFIIKDVQPFHILKSSSFKEFVHSLNPHFNIPCITTIKESLEVMYDHLANELGNKLINDCQFVSITTDFWTATNQRKGYMGITGTWLTENFEPIEVLLNLVHVPYPHTGIIIKDLLENEIRKWELDWKLSAITTDNGSNMVSALKLLKNSLEIDRIPCSAHTFQLCIKKALNYNDEIKALVLRAKRLINFFSSPKQLEALEKQQERMKEEYPKVLKPTFDVITRWNSTFKAWVRLLELKKAIILLTMHMELNSDREVKKDAKKLKSFLLSNQEWELIEKLVSILSHFDTITTTLSGKNFVTLSLIFPLISYLKKKLLNILNNDDDNDDGNNDDDDNNDGSNDNNDNNYEEEIPPINAEYILNEAESLEENQEPSALHSIEENDQGEVQIFEERNGEKRKKKINISRPANISGLYKKIILTLYNSIEHYWSDPSIVAMLASALDPRFKHLKFVDEKTRLETLNFLKVQYEIIKEQRRQSTSSFHPSSVLFPSGNNSGIFDDLFNDLMQYEEEEVQGEYEKYISLPTANRQTDPFIWWNSKKNEFPNMSILAKKYLCINATSVPSE